MSSGVVAAVAAKAEEADGADGAVVAEDVEAAAVVVAAA